MHPLRRHKIISVRYRVKQNLKSRLRKLVHGKSFGKVVRKLPAWFVKVAPGRDSFGCLYSDFLQVLQKFFKTRGVQYRKCVSFEELKFPKLVVGYMCWVASREGGREREHNLYFFFDNGICFANVHDLRHKTTLSLYCCECLSKKRSNNACFHGLEIQHEIERETRTMMYNSDTKNGM